MRAWIVVTVFTLGLVAGCMAAGPPLTASSGGSADEPRSPLGSPFTNGKVGALSRSWPLILDRGDVSLGTTVYFNRVPTVNELHDLDGITGVQRVVVSLPVWPSEIGPLEAFGQLNPEASGVVILPGYPPTRAAAEVWNLVPARLRIIVLVDGPPATSGVFTDLNAMRGLERVIAEMDVPSRAGFERLQRPLSFRKVIE